MRRFDPAYNDMKETFERIDANHNGTIEFGEFKNLMLDLDHTRTEGAMRVQFASIDANRDGRVSLDEFNAWFGIER